MASLASRSLRTLLGCSRSVRRSSRSNSRGVTPLCCRLSSTISADGSLAKRIPRSTPRGTQFDARLASSWRHGFRVAAFSRRRYTTSPDPKQDDRSSPSTNQSPQPPSPPSPPPRPLTALSRRSHLLPPTITPHENIYTIPNLLTTTRLLSAPLIGYSILTTHPHLALSLFIFSAATDLLDGYLARRYHSTTVVGTILDPMADKTLMTIVTVSLAFQGSLPIYLAVLILGRDVLLAMSAVYYRWISLPEPKTFRRYWDFSLPSAEVRPTGISKVNTALQLGLVGVTMALPVLGEGALGVWVAGWMGVFQGIVAVTTVWSGASYVFSRDAVRILGREKGKGGK